MGYITIIIIISVIVWLIFGFLSQDIRERKGYEGGWLAGFLFGIFALIYNAGLPDLVVREEVEELKKAIEEKDTNSEISDEESKLKNNKQINNINKIKHSWRCIHCGEIISEDPCPYCKVKQ